MKPSEALRKNKMNGWSAQFESWLQFYGLPLKFPGIGGVETAFRAGWRAAFQRAIIIAEQEEAEVE